MHAPRVARTARLLLIIATLAGCDETLPPRSDPLDIIAQRFECIEGKVVWSEGDTVTQGLPGTFVISVANGYDEVLQATADIDIDIDVWLTLQPTHKARIHINRENVSGTLILQGSLLTLFPDSESHIIHQWDHRTSEGKRFWYYGGLMLDSVVYFFDTTYFFQTQPMQFSAKARVGLFKGVADLQTEEITYTLDHKIYVPYGPHAIKVEDLRGTLHSNGTVTLNWFTPQESDNFGFAVQKSSTDIPTSYASIPNAFVPGRGTVRDTTYYEWVDSAADPGVWYYRLEQLEDFGIIQFPVAHTGGTRIEIQ